jgi:hypothetical protein
MKPPITAGAATYSTTYRPAGPFTGEALPGWAASHRKLADAGCQRGVLTGIGGRVPV